MSCSSAEPVFASARTISSREIQPSVYEVRLEYHPAGGLADGRPHQVEPGLFFMLRREPSQVLLSRPISVYWAEQVAGGAWLVTFLILLKGQGTAELCSLAAGDRVSLIGPLGNTFPKPDRMEDGAAAVCVVGGGIGVAVRRFQSAC